MPPAALSDIRVAPYGIAFVNAFSNSGGSNNIDIPFFATGGPGNVSASARGTRLGIRLSGATVGRAKLAGVIEADFFGGFPAVGIGDNMGVVRLRMALARLDWAKTSLVAGQDWMVFAPGNPFSLACHGIPLLAGSGNAWSRLPQLRLERRQGALTFQAAALAPSTGDFGSTFLAQPGSGGLGKEPFFQGRLALGSSNWLGSKKPASIAASGHFGRSRSALPSGHVDNDSVAGALDWSVPLGARVVLSGEAFTGKNLAGFQAGVFQGLNPDPATQPGAAAPAGPKPISSKGGWAQLGFTPPGLDKWTLYGSYGVDDPDAADLKSVSRRDWRLVNRTFGFSFVNRLSDRLAWSVEMRQMRTTLLQSGRKRNTHVNLGVSLAF